MPDLLVRPHAPDTDGVVLEITPQSAGWSHVGLRVQHVPAGRAVYGRTPGRETCLVLVSGAADVEVGNKRFPSVGGRATPFEDRAPGAVLLPSGAHWTLTALTDVELAVCTAPAEGGDPPRVITAKKMAQSTRGEGTNTRHIRDILPETEPAEALLVVEVITPGGHWSSYPPHKHDEAAPGLETVLEETYLHRLDPPTGFAFQRVYTDDRSLDVSMAVGDGDAVMVPRGYHPVAAPFGHTLYYLNVMAGPERRWLFRDEPGHSWLRRL